MELKKNKIVPHSEDNRKAIKFSLSIMCASNKRNFMWISTDEKTIPLMVVSKIQNLNISFLSKYFSRGILNLKNIYMIIFIYVGLNIFRQVMFNQTVRIWHSDIPRPDVVLLLIDSINYARYENDLVKEELLFLMLMDIMRNPEMLREITDSVLFTREDLYNKQLKGIGKEVK